MTQTTEVVFIHEHVAQDGNTYEPSEDRAPVELDPAEARLAIHVGHAVLAEEYAAIAPASEPEDAEQPPAEQQPADVPPAVVAGANQKPSTSSKSTQPPTTEVDKTKEQGR